MITPAPFDAHDAAGLVCGQDALPLKYIEEVEADCFLLKPNLTSAWFGNGAILYGENLCSAPTLLGNDLSHYLLS